ncbi:hypothetical protein PG994_012790 [Apiospora phragmitis]|uniref:Zn(2)-C6 fungal-type domain-containing protein n=1 Tax=Apiospora phragmitis TaxID=2905665 RepID=A0ABR1TBF2_9PEZI
MSQLVAAACTACAKAKHKCGKQKPACLRCHKRGARCAYPPEKPSAFVLVADSSSSTLPFTASTAVSLEHGHQPYQQESFESSLFGYLASEGASITVQGVADLETVSMFPDSRAEFQMTTNWPGGDNLVWQTWIMAECVRRTWVVISGIQAIYLIARQNDSAFIHPVHGRHDGDDAERAVGGGLGPGVAPDLRRGQCRTGADGRGAYPVLWPGHDGHERHRRFHQFALLVGHGEHQLSVSEWQLP